MQEVTEAVCNKDGELAFGDNVVTQIQETHQQMR